MAEKTGCSRRLNEQPEPKFYILLTFSLHFGMNLTVSFSKSAVLNCPIYESSRVKVSHEKYHAVASHRG